MTVESDTKIQASRYYAYADKNIALWQPLEGRRVLHTKLGNGTISKVEQNDQGQIYIRVRFDNSVEPEEKGTLFQAEAFNTYITELTLSADLLTVLESYEDAVRQKEEQAREAAKLANQKALEAERAQIAQKHKNHMQEYGVPYKGEKESSAKTLRETHCWRCKRPIDNFTRFECSVCGWIICDCGACGCGYQKKGPARA